MGTNQAQDWDALEAPDPPRKRILKKDPLSALDGAVRDFVFKTDEDWLTPRYLSTLLRVGASHVGTVLKRLASEGLLSLPMLVSKDGSEEVLVLSESGHGGKDYGIRAYVHAGRWVVGYYDRDYKTKKPTILINGKPDAWRWRRVRKTGTIHGRVTKKEWERIAASFKYEPAKWDGKAFFVLRFEQPYLNACVAAGIEPNWDIEWVCGRCGRKQEKSKSKCGTCKMERPRLVPPPKPVEKECPNCGEKVATSHARRHGRSANRKEYYTCMQKMVELVHRM